MLISNFKINNSAIWCIVISNCDQKLDLESDIKRFLQNNYIPEKVYVLQPDNEVEYLIAKERIPNFSKISIEELVYTNSGDILNKNTRKTIKPQLYQNILDAIYDNVFRKYDTIIKASHQSYFNLPSKKFATHFVRIANVFSNSEEINILSIFLLPHFQNNPEIIYCDTPSIFPVIYSCILIKNMNDEKYNPKFKTYSPYKVDRDDIENINNSLFVISTSINGSLPMRLNEIGIDWSKICVLFNFDSTNSQKYRTVGKLSAGSLLGSEFYSLEPKDFRKKFPDRTFEIKFENGHFIPTAPLINYILINKDDADKYLSDFMQSYKDYDFIKCYSGKNSRNKLRDLYFDVSKLLRSFNESKPNYFEEKTNKLLINLLPINLVSIIYVDKEESQYLAEKIQEYYFVNHNREIQIIFYKDLKFDKATSKPSSYLVCSSCISDGKKVSNVSRILRSQENSQILYFNGFLRCKDETAFKNIRNAIQYGKYGWSTYTFITIDKIFLPNEDSDTVSWEMEKEFLNGLLGINDYKLESLIKKKTKNYFQKRFDELNSNKGLSENVFLPKHDYKPLMLNKNFAFFDFSSWEPKDIQQSKVYFTMVSVLHRIRVNRNISQTVFERFLLSPENFNRYNDGIIQAALLRGANKHELNYQIDLNASNKMASIILASIDETNNDDAAPYEFLMAICIGKLTLHKSDLEQICEKHSNHKDNIIQIFIRIINSRFLK